MSPTAEPERQQPAALRLLFLAALGTLSGALAGLACALFMWGLVRVTDVRLHNEWLIWFLPIAGLVVGAAYHHLGGRAKRGNALLIDEIHEPTAWVPRRMAPMVLVGTWTTHLFGGSAGREGTALQLSGSLTDLVSRTMGLARRDRRVMLNASLAGGFGAMFGVPIAGVVFAMELPTRRKLHLEAAVPAVFAAFTGYGVMGLLGQNHPDQMHVQTALEPLEYAKVALAGVAFGLVAITFVRVTRWIVAGFARFVRYLPLRPLIGGVAIVVLVAAFGTDYVGLSEDLYSAALAGDDVSPAAFALKLVFTAVTLGSGFIGGEVTPLFVMGGTLGSVLGSALGMAPSTMAAVGGAAVFAGAAKTPLACSVMAMELFGIHAGPPALVASIVATIVSADEGIYPTQRAARPAPRLPHQFTPTGRSKKRSR